MDALTVLLPQGIQKGAPYAIQKISSALLALCLLAGYGQCAALDQTTDTMDLRPTVVLEDQAVPLAAAPMPVASGTAAKTTARATIDYSNTKDGYVMVRFTVTSGKSSRLRSPARPRLILMI